MVDYKEILGWLSGATIAVVWIAYALLGAGDMLFLVVALAITILLGTLSGGLIALSKKKINYKEVLGWLSGATIPVAWIAYALLEPGDMLFLVVALAITILMGTLSGGLIALSKKAIKES